MMADSKMYKSPVHKLVKFFEKSRDQWKAKHGVSKQENKRLTTKVERLNASKKRWRAEALSLRKQLRQMSRSVDDAIPDVPAPLKKTDAS